MSQGLYRDMIIFIVYTQINICASNTINTNDASEYENGIITCNNAENCTVICDENHACYNADIYCPSGYSCDIQCITDAASSILNVCAQSTIHCTDSTQCDITCTDIDDKSAWGEACGNAIFNWPSNKEYNLHCGSGRPCEGIIIDPKYNDEPFVWNCDSASCRSMTFNCPTNSTCNISCNAMGACQHITLNCDTTGTYPCSISCHGFNGCLSGVINGIGTVTECSSTTACNALIFPDPPSDVDYTLNCAETAACSEAVITCPTDAECHIICSGSRSCENTQITWPTNTAYNASLTCLDDNACLNVERPPTHVTIDPTSVPIIQTVDPTFNPVALSTQTVDVTVLRSTTAILDTFENTTEQEIEDVVTTVDATFNPLSSTTEWIVTTTDKGVNMYAVLIGTLSIVIFIAVIMILRFIYLINQHNADHIKPDILPPRHESSASECDNAQADGVMHIHPDLLDKDMKRHAQTAEFAGVKSWPEIDVNLNVEGNAVELTKSNNKHNMDKGPAWKSEAEASLQIVEGSFGIDVSKSNGEKTCVVNTITKDYGYNIQDDEFIVQEDDEMTDTIK